MNSTVSKRCRASCNTECVEGLRVETEGCTSIGDYTHRGTMIYLVSALMLQFRPQVPFPKIINGCWLERSTTTGLYRYASVYSTVNVENLLKLSMTQKRAK